MSDKFQITLNLSQDEIAFLDRKLAIGDFSSADELVSAGIDLMRERDGDFETWLCDVGVPTYDRMQADPTRGIPAEDVLRRIQARSQPEKQIA